MKKEDDFQNGFGCAIVSIDSSSSPKVATLDFGTGCTDAQGRTYSGVIQITYTDPDMGHSGNHISAVFNHFNFDSISFDGTFDYYNNGKIGRAHV